MDCSEKTFACCFDEDTNFDAEIMAHGVNFFTTYIGKYFFSFFVFPNLKSIKFQVKKLTVT